MIGTRSREATGNGVPTHGSCRVCSEGKKKKKGGWTLGELEQTLLEVKKIDI